MSKTDQQDWAPISPNTHTGFCTGDASPAFPSCSAGFSTASGLSAVAAIAIAAIAATP